jgi:hypothetical protein
LHKTKTAPTRARSLIIAKGISKTGLLALPLRSFQKNSR